MAWPASHALSSTIAAGEESRGPGGWPAAPGSPRACRAALDGLSPPLPHTIAPPPIVPPTRPRAHGRYHDALKDAEFVMRNTEGAALGAAMSRVKNIKDYIKRMNNFDPGYHNATTTLVCLLRPREHRQLVQSNPSQSSKSLAATT